MQYFPIYVDANYIHCLVVGAGEVAARKIELLLKTPAQITVVAPRIGDTVQELVRANKNITLVERKFEDNDISEKQMVFVATDDNKINEYIHDLAHAKRILVNVVDNTSLCKFITPSIVDRSPIIIAMSSGGVAPVLLRYIRQKLESILPTNLRILGELSEKYREKVKRSLKTVTERRYFWEEVLDGDIGETALAGQEDAASRKFEDTLAAFKSSKRPMGQVYLVGAGPGATDLLTFKALRLMQKADVVVYDRLVSNDIVELVRRDAEKIYVGKEKSNHTIGQAQINQLLVDEAKKGNRVVRLKGGDPFIFGRGGEELESLIENKIDFQVVPGITAANGASSYAGIPLTHRDHAHTVTFTTGHLKDDTVNLNWAALVQKNQTLVFYMGLTGLEIICKKLIKHGMSSSMPIALIQNATREEQKTLTGTLFDILHHPNIQSMKPPTLIIIGSVVRLQSTLSWFQK